MFVAATGIMLLVVFPSRPLNEVEHATRLVNREELRIRIERRAHALVTPSPRRHSLSETNCAAHLPALSNRLREAALD